MAPRREFVGERSQRRCEVFGLALEPLPSRLIGDLILACDCTYNAALHEPLLQTLVSLFARQRNAKAWDAPDEAWNADAARTLAKFQKSLAGHGLVIGEIPDGAWRRRMLEQCGPSWSCRSRRLHRNPH